MQHVISQESTSDLQTTKLTRALLVCGIVAGPFFTIVGLTQAFTRPGFDLTRHALSLLSNGDLGGFRSATSCSLACCSSRVQWGCDT
jgi:hypothetical protein